MAITRAQLRSTHVSLDDDDDDDSVAGGMRKKAEVGVPLTLLDNINET